MSKHPELDEVLLAWCGGGDWRVLGHRLRPLTLLHIELLRMINSGVVTGGKMNLPELDLAARICSMDPWRAGRWLTRRRKGWWQIWERARFTLVLLRWWRALPEQWGIMTSYAEATLKAPEMMVREQAAAGASEKRDAPAFLDSWAAMVEAGFPHREVVGVWPASLIGWLQETLASREGGRKFITSTDRELMRKAAAARAMTDPTPTEAKLMELRALRMRALTQRVVHGTPESAQSGQ